MKQSASHSKHEILTLSERFGELVAIGVMLVFSGFFIYHQVAETGFFTSEFGTVEMFCLYAPLVFSLFPPFIRSWQGRRNPARPFEAFLSLFLGICSLWLLIVFPFDFTHLADALPSAIRFPLSEVTNDIGKIPLVIQIIIAPFTALSALWKYVAVRHSVAIA